MLRALINIFKIADLRNKLLFTMGMLVIYRIGFWIPLPGVNQAELTKHMETQSGALGEIAKFVGIFTGGNLQQSTLFGLGIMPYISAAIIFQLLATVLPSLERLRKEGAAGQQKIQEYTRYATVGLCIIQAFVWVGYVHGSPDNLVYPELRGTALFWLSGIVGLTAGTIIMMWLGEQIDKYGIGNGASLIITAGILSSIPSAIGWVAKNTEMVAGAADDKLGPLKLLFLIGSFVFVTGGCVLITQGQRRIPVQQAKHTRGRRVYGGQRSYLPLRVNHGGVMPIIFASSLLMIPIMGSKWFSSFAQNATAKYGVEGSDPMPLWTKMWTSSFSWFSDNFQMGAYLYEIIYILLIYFFAYFWTTVQFQPREISINLRDNGSFIPGLRPGPRTAEYLERVMERITYVGAGFLAIIAVVPSVISGALGIDLFVTSFLGGTALLISVSVILDFVQRLEAGLLMRNYQGFLGEGPGGGKGPRIRGARG